MSENIARNIKITTKVEMNPAKEKNNNSIRKIEFIPKENEALVCPMPKRDASAAKVLIKISCRSNGNGTVTRTVTQNTPNDDEPPVRSITTINMENSRKRKSLGENQADEPLIKRPSNESVTDDSIEIVNETSNNSDESVIFVDETRYEDPTPNERAFAVEKSKKKFGVKDGKIKKKPKKKKKPKQKHKAALESALKEQMYPGLQSILHMPSTSKQTNPQTEHQLLSRVKSGKINKKVRQRKRKQKKLKKQMPNEVMGEIKNAATQVSRFTPRTSNTPAEPEPFQIDNIKVNPCALAARRDPEPMNYADEVKLFAEHPELFEKRMIIIDGSNVAYAFGHVKKEFSVKGIEICLQYFEEKGFNVRAVVPQKRMQWNMSTDQVGLMKLKDIGKVITSPSKNIPGNRSSSYDDRFILELADKLDAAVISNDNYADLLAESAKWDKIIHERVIGFLCCENIIIFPPDPYGRNGKSLDMILHKRKSSFTSNV